MRFREISPPAPLQSLVRCYWVLEDGAARAPGPIERVLPDGCIELVLHHGEHFLRHDADGRVEAQARAVVAGQLRTALMLQSSGAVGAFGVRFEPAGAALFLGPDADELTGQVCALDDLALPGADELVEAMAEADGDAARIALVTRWLLQRLATRRAADDNLSGVLAAVALIERLDGAVDLGELARHLGWSPRRLQRAFLAHVGVSAKTLCRVVRFQRVVRALGQDPAASLAALSLDAGYADQAHLARDFKQLAGVSATAWLAEQHPLNDCFSGVAPDRADDGSAPDAPP